MAQSGASHWSERDSGELWLADGLNTGDQDDITTPETTSNNKTICSQHFNGGFTIEGINVLPQMTLPFICKNCFVSFHTIFKVSQLQTVMLCFLLLWVDNNHLIICKFNVKCWDATDGFIRFHKMIFIYEGLCKMVKLSISLYHNIDNLFCVAINFILLKIHITTGGSIRWL